MGRRHRLLLSAVLSAGLAVAGCSKPAGPASGAQPAAGAGGGSKAVADAREFVAVADIPCEVAAARRVGLKVYEVACARGLGWVLLETAADNVESYNCLQMAAEAAKGDPSWPLKGVTCELPANADQAPKLEPVIASAGWACRPRDARVIDTDVAGFYAEVACADGKGLVLETPPHGKASVHNCAEYYGGASQCQLTTRPQLAAWLGRTAGAHRPCEVSRFRYLTYRAAGEVYYELACRDGGDFVLETDSHGGFGQALDCAKAAAMAIGDGCKLGRARSHEG